MSQLSVLLRGPIASFSRRLQDGPLKQGGGIPLLGCAALATVLLFGAGTGPWQRFELTLQQGFARWQWQPAVPDPVSHVIVVVPGPTYYDDAGHWAWLTGYLRARDAHSLQAWIPPGQLLSEPVQAVLARSNIAGPALSQRADYAWLARTAPPRVRLTALRQNRVAAAAFAGRRVLIVPARLDRPMQLQALAERWIGQQLTRDQQLELHQPIAVLRWTLVLIAALGTLACLARLPLFVALRLISSGGLVLGALQWLLLTQWHFWLPLSAIYLAVALTTAFCIYRFYLTERQQLLLKLSDLRRLIAARPQPADLLRDQQYWHSISALLDDVLRLPASLFLEATPGHSRLSVVHSIRCSLADVQERRRDHQRAPYATAASCSGPLAVSQFLARPPAGDQYLIALKHQHRLIGFWAFVTESAEQRSDQLAAATLLAPMIAEILALRLNDEWLNASPGWLTSRHTITPQLDAAMVAVNQRNALLETLINDGERPVLAFDLFGNRLLSNAAGTTLLRELRLASASYANLLSRIAEVGARQLQATLRAAVLSRKPQWLPGASAALEGYRGIRLKTLDITHTDASLNAPLGALLVIELFEDLPADQATRQQAGLTPVQAVAATPDLARAQTLRLLPQRVLLLGPQLQQAAASHQPTITAKGLLLTIAMAHDQPCPVLPLTELRALFDLLLAVLVADARPGSELRLAAATLDRTLVVHGRSDGFGIGVDEPAIAANDDGHHPLSVNGPVARVIAPLASTGPQADYAALRQQILRLHGTLDYQARLGSGVELMLRLPLEQP